ncbi:MAG: hypothetical protein Q3985_04975 [Eubacteriales bacterium]|nr:hypothetical protein [Eubacteriales bacterium]
MKPTAEQLTKMKTAKSAEGTLADEELDNVAGGCDDFQMYDP